MLECMNRLDRKCNLPLLKDFQREALFVFHSRRAQQSTDGFGRASLPPDYFSQVVGMDSQLKHDDLFAFNHTNLNCVRLVH